MKEQTLTKGFAVLSIAGMAVKVLSLLYIPFLLAIIGEEGYGIYSAAYQVFVFVYVLTNAGTPVAISKLVSELSALKNYKDAVRSFKIARFLLLVIGIVMSLLMLVLAAPLSRALHYEKSYLAILALSPTILITSVASAYRGYFQGRGNMTPTAVSQVIEQIANTVFTLVFAYLLLKYGIEAACAGGTIGTTLGALLSIVYLTSVYSKNKSFTLPADYNPAEIKRYSYKQLVQKIMYYGIPITICVGMQYAGNLVDLWNTKARLLSAGFSDPAATEMYSYLAKYQQLMNAPIAIAVALATAILPAISAAVALKDRELVRKRTNYAFRLCFLVAVPSAAGMCVLSSPIFSLLKLGGGSFLMLYGSAVLVLMSVVQIQTAILQSSNRLFTVTFHLILGIIVKITVNYFLIGYPEINIMGAVFGSMAGFLVPIVLNNMLIKKSLKIKFKLLKHVVKPLAASAFMGVSVYMVYLILFIALGTIGSGYWINAVATAISIAVGAFIYLLSLVLVRGIVKEDLNSMPARLVRLIPKFVIDMVK